MNRLVEKEYTQELNVVLEYIENTLLKKYPSAKVTPEFFLLSILDNTDSVAYQNISKAMFSETIETYRQWYNRFLGENFGKKNHDIEGELTFDDRLLNVAKYIKDNVGTETVNSGDILYALVETDDVIKKSFRLVGVTEAQLRENTAILDKETTPVTATDDAKLLTVLEEKPNKVKPYEKKKQNKPKNNEVEKTGSYKYVPNEVDKQLVSLNKLAAEGKVDEVYGNDDVINEIFANFQKCYKNNVVLVGESGCGKTATVRHIANLIVNENVPKPFLKKKLVVLDFAKLITGTGFRGSFEAKFGSIVSDAKKDGNYIFFIDDIHAVLNEKSKFGEVDIETMLDSILSEKSIQFVCTTNPKSYKTVIEANPFFKRRLQKVELETPSLEKTIDILWNVKSRLETYHNVEYGREIIELCARLSKQYITDNVLPDSAINVLDKIGAKITLMEQESEDIAEIKNKLRLNQIEKERLDNLPYKNYDKYDELTRKEIQLNTRLAILEKEKYLNRIPYKVTEDELRSAVSEMAKVPLQKVTVNEMDRLRNINENIKLSVIGQDEAIDCVCNAIKKQKLGISNPDKPAVFLFTGSTGTGKTLLAKKIAKEVYGDEKFLVRLDMSEYSDKMSVNKLYGAASGYIGYDNGGILTEAIKNNKHCVLLLDEIEKANEEVHNVFLQLFDDGRLTDNTGYVVDFKNVIIIMTSNLGAREVDERGDGIGFAKDAVANNTAIIDKAIKRKFKPEFINRINKIVHFNRLTDDNIRDIIRLELRHFEERLNNADYYLDENFIDDCLVQDIYDKIDSNKFGARAIIRQIEMDVEDVITECILVNGIDKKHTFTKVEVYGV